MWVNVYLKSVHFIPYLDVMLYPLVCIWKHKTWRMNGNAEWLLLELFAQL